MYNISFLCLAQITHDTFSVRSMIIHGFLKNHLCYYVHFQRQEKLDFFLFSFTAEFPSLPLIKGQGWLETVAMHGCLVIAGRVDIKPACQTVDRHSGQHSGSGAQRRTEWHPDGGGTIWMPLWWWYVRGLPSTVSQPGMCVCVRHKNKMQNVYMRSWYYGKIGHW